MQMQMREGGEVNADAEGPRPAEGRARLARADGLLLDDLGELFAHLVVLGRQLLDLSHPRTHEGRTVAPNLMSLVGSHLALDTCKGFWVYMYKGFWVGGVWGEAMLRGRDLPGSGGLG